MTRTRPKATRLRELSRLADTNAWDSVSLRLIGSEYAGYLFTRGLTEVEVRATVQGRIVRAVRTSPAEPDADPPTGRFEAAASWLTAPPAPLPAEIVRRTRVHRSIGGSMFLVTTDICAQCGGPINNAPVTRTHADDNDRWVHVYDADWVDNVHHARPVGGPVTDHDQPGPWRIAGRPV